MRRIESGFRAAGEDILQDNDADQTSLQSYATWVANQFEGYRRHYSRFPYGKIVGCSHRFGNVVNNRSRFIIQGSLPCFNV